MDASTVIMQASPSVSDCIESSSHNMFVACSVVGCVFIMVGDE